jgi:hypothetical protein
LLKRTTHLSVAELLTLDVIKVLGDPFDGSRSVAQAEHGPLPVTDAFKLLQRNREPRRRQPLEGARPAMPSEKVFRGGIN